MTMYSPADSRLVEVPDQFATGQARRTAADLAADLGFEPVQAGNLAIVVTEAANNLAQHAQGGLLLLQSLRQGAATFIEVVAVDRGPGMADVSRSMQDGYSTAGTAGQGLGAIARLADLLEIYSMPGAGTALLARVRASRAQVPPISAWLSVGVVNLPQPGQVQCGDSWAVSEGADRSVVLMADGLGHGPAAAEAAQEARRVFLEHPSSEPAAVLRIAHDALRKTRGAAVAIAQIDWPQRQIRFAGVGNISAMVRSDQTTRSMVSYNGIVGHELRKVQEFTYPFPEDSTLLIHSDGLSSHCQPDLLPGLMHRHPGLVAGMLFRECARGRDDATILVARQRGPGTSPGG